MSVIRFDIDTVSFSFALSNAHGRVSIWHSLIIIHNFDSVSLIPTFEARTSNIFRDSSVVKVFKMEERSRPNVNLDFLQNSPEIPGNYYTVLCNDSTPNFS